MTPQPHRCERVRSQFCLLLDGELSQLERRMVARHLEDCAGCRAFGETATAFTRELREAPLELRAVPLDVRRLPTRRYRRVSFTAAQVGVAASVAIAVLGGLRVADVAPPEPQRVSSAPLIRTPARVETSSHLPRGVRAPQVFADIGTDPSRNYGPQIAV